MTPASLDFAQPWALLLLPLAVLPLLPRRRDTQGFPWLAWLPADRWGRAAGWLWHGLAVLALLATALALASPGLPETQVMRTGRGAEILLLLDRSRSMDERMLPPDWRSIDPIVLRHQARSRGPQKGQVARDLLMRFVEQRPDDRFAVMFFSARPIHVVPFTQHDAAVRAGIAAGGVGRGLAETDVGRALLAAVAEFDQRAYAGNRIVLLVSDGGARLDDRTQRQLRAGLTRNRISLYWVYLRSIGGPRLDDAAAAPGNSANTSTDNTSTDTVPPELALHRTFQSLATPYGAYQADAEEDLQQAIVDVGARENFPLEFAERVPRLDFTPHCLAVAAVCCALLLAARAVFMRPTP